MSFGSKIQDLRKQNDMTQDELGAKLFVTRASVSKWERDLSIPTEDTLERISKLFNVSIDELLDKKDFIRNSDKMKKRLKKILISSISAGVALVIIVITLVITLATRKPEYVYPDTIEYYALFTGIDDTNLYVDTENGSEIIPLDNIYSFTEGDEIVDYDDLKYHDYGLVKKTADKYSITITDHEETDGIIIPEYYMGFVLSLENDKTRFTSDEVNPYFMVGSDWIGSNIFNVFKSRNRTVDLTFKYYSGFIENSSENMVNIYGVTGYDNATGDYKLELFKSINTKYTYSTVSIKFLGYNTIYKSSQLYSYVTTFNCKFSSQSKNKIKVYQYDVNMDLINTFEINDNYYGETNFWENSVSAFYNVITVNNKVYASGVNDVESLDTYKDIMPKAKHGFYDWGGIC